MTAFPSQYYQCIAILLLLQLLLFFSASYICHKYCDLLNFYFF